MNFFVERRKHTVQVVIEIYTEKQQGTVPLGYSKRSKKASHEH